MTGFSKFWFIAGGGIHGVWKKREWRTLRYLAEHLPERAWNEAVEQCAQLIEQERCREWSPKECASQIRERLKTSAAKTAREGEKK